MMNAKNVMEKAKMAAICAVPAVMTCPLIAHAAEGDTDPVAMAGEALTTALTSMSGTITSAISTVLPVAIPFVGVPLVVTIGLRIFKRVAGQA